MNPGNKLYAPENCKYIENIDRNLLMRANKYTSTRLPTYTIYRQQINIDKNKSLAF